MFARHDLEKTLLVIVLLIGIWSNLPALAAEGDAAKRDHKAAGILIDRKEDWITVKADGEDEPIKYLIDSADKKLANALKPIFPVSRIQLTYKVNGDSKHLVGIKRQVSKAAGTVTGVVVKNYGWWVEVKPRGGVADGYACHLPFDKNKDMMEKINGLQEGDTVSIKFTTDFERHRIETLTVQKKTNSALHGGSTSQSGSSPKK
jgi:hypothetical protein